jgi:hypothetical protein
MAYVTTLYKLISGPGLGAYICLTYNSVIDGGENGISDHDCAVVFN